MRIVSMLHGCLCLIVALAATGGEAHGQGLGSEPILLWPDGAPGAVGEEPVDKPTVQLMLAPEEDNTGAMVVICPGGGYGALAYDHEGFQVGKWFNSFGVNAAVVKYRLGPRYHHPAPLQDAQRAIRYVRLHADELGIDSARVGIMGFSAGGHLASTVSTHFDAGDSESDDPVARMSSRPDFTVLCYPVISLMSDFGHRGSARNLLGENPDPELLKSLSNETQVTSETPPTFIFHTAEDPGVPVMNALVYYQALVKNDVLAELHVYQFGPHGVGLASGDPVTSTWTKRLADWMKVNNWLAPQERGAVSGKVLLNGEPLRWGAVTIETPNNPRQIVAWALVARGNFRIPAERGPAVGAAVARVYNLGDVVPWATLEDATEISAADGIEVTIEATSELELDF